jgi:hypothetical protein
MFPFRGSKPNIFVDFSADAKTDFGKATPAAKAAEPDKTCLIKFLLFTFEAMAINGWFNEQQ